MRWSGGQKGAWKKEGLPQGCLFQWRRSYIIMILNRDEELTDSERYEQRHVDFRLEDG